MVEKKARATEKSDYNDVVKEFEKHFNDPDQFYKIFSELGFSYVDDGCTGACDCCDRKNTCETYAKSGT